MKAALVALALILALSSYAYAVLRPRVPHHTRPPVGDQTAIHEAPANSVPMR